ncbi:unnamed protein product [Lupinus luteus]|uniref:Calmodulin-binding domain-containing protein n=1 Tax=Lupinus luteus TaxID=3873 RepID=A0AAV1XW29_LUPLU
MTEVVYEKIEAEYDDEKENPIEGLTIKKGLPKTVSRYLSGPRGSYHDACKYGTRRAIEAKPWKTNKKKAAKKERKIEVPEEHVTHFARNKTSGSSSKPSSVSKAGKSNIPIEIIKEVLTSEKNSTPLEETEVSIELNNSGIRQIQSEPSSIAVEEKNMFHKTGSASRSPSVLSYISSSNLSLGKRNVATSYKIRPNLSTIVGAANMAVPARKLTFKRGRVIELQPQSNNIARRLKFRPPRLLGDDFQNNVNGTIRRIITSKEGDNSESNAANTKAENFVYKYQTVEGSKRRSIVRKIGEDRSKIDGSKSGSEKVVLRREIIVGEKLNPRLYNNVIEETASMLAGLRKSNVKALVGAFETVISLDSPRAEATPVEGIDITDSVESLYIHIFKLSDTEDCKYAVAASKYLYLTK